MADNYECLREQRIKHDQLCRFYQGDSRLKELRRIMTNEKRRLTVGNDNWQEIMEVAESASVFSGTCDEDEPLLTVAIRSRNMWHQRPYIFHCLPGDILVEYADGTWGLIEKETKQSRAMSALEDHLSRGIHMLPLRALPRPAGRKSGGMADNDECL